MHKWFLYHGMALTVALEANGLEQGDILWQIKEQEVEEGEEQNKEQEQEKEQEKDQEKEQEEEEQKQGEGDGGAWNGSFIMLSQDDFIDSWCQDSVGDCLQL